MKIKDENGVTLLEMVIAIMLLMVISSFVSLWLRMPIQNLFMAKNFAVWLMQLENGMFQVEEALLDTHLGNIKYHLNSLSVINQKQQTINYWCDKKLGKLFMTNSAYNFKEPQVVANHIVGCEFKKVFDKPKQVQSLRFELQVGQDKFNSIKLVRYFYIPYES